MQLSSASTTDGVSERHFTLDDIPGVLWSPPGGPVDRPLVLLAHGGGQHKLAPPVLGRAHHYVTRYGFAVAAIDAPGHGDRPRQDRDEEFVAGLRQRMADREPVGPHVAAYNAEIVALAVPDWRSVLDGLGAAGAVDPQAPVGVFGVSLGGAVAIALTAADPRITAAVLGLVGGKSQTEAASRVRVPVQLLLQSDDEIVSRDAGLALYDALASAEKTVHLNPGPHQAVPRFELEDSGTFFVRHLGAGGRA